MNEATNSIDYISFDLDDYATSKQKPVVKRIDAIKDKYLEFYTTTLPNRKTPIIAVYNKVSQEVIGEIKWYPPFRQYCFFPEDETVYHDGCMNKIVECITYLKKEQEARKS